ncbi:MAG: PepSY domain-containing protein [Pseudomonadota bacterium]
MTLITRKTFAALAGIALLTPAIALAGVTVGDTIGMNDAEIETALTAQGYTIEEIEREDGEIEVEAMLDGVEYEIEIDPETGAILEIELEDDDD